MELQFRNWLLEEAMHQYNRLVVYDFDSTLANVPEKPSDWEGKDWWGHEDSLSPPHYGGEMNHEVVESMKRDNADPHTKAILLTGRRGVISHLVRKTLRNQGLYGKRIIPDSNKNVLQKFKGNVEAGHDEIHPHEGMPHGHEEFYSGDHITEPDYPKTQKGKLDSSTLVHKTYRITKEMNSEIESLEFWEDRADHIPHFVKLGLDLLKQYGFDQGGRLEKVILHRVYPPSIQGGQGVVQHIPIKPGMP
jgi:hypothetical protein